MSILVDSSSLSNCSLRALISLCHTSVFALGQIHEDSSEMMELGSSHWFGETVSNHVISWTADDLQIAFLDLISDKEAPDIKVFCLLAAA